MVMRESQFLINGFFNENMKVNLFADNYYEYFTKYTLKSGEYLFNENDNNEYLFFLREGTFELLISKNIFEISELIDFLRKILGENIENEELEIDYGGDILHKFREY